MAKLNQKENKKIFIYLFIIYFMTTIRQTHGEWECRCMVNYKYVMIGYFKTKIDAINAYNDYVILHNLNRKLKSIK
jgi:hypothetical protein